LALWTELAAQSLTLSLWVIIGMAGLLAAAIRTIAVLVMTDLETKWSLTETWVQTAMLGVGVIGLFILGMFPQAMQPFLASLPTLFEHLGQ